MPPKYLSSLMENDFGQDIASKRFYTMLSILRVVCFAYNPSAIQYTTHKHTLFLLYFIVYVCFVCHYFLFGISLNCIRVLHVHMYNTRCVLCGQNYKPNSKSLSKKYVLSMELFIDFSFVLFIKLNGFSHTNSHIRYVLTNDLNN